MCGDLARWRFPSAGSVSVLVARKVCGQLPCEIDVAVDGRGAIDGATGISRCH